MHYEKELAVALEAAGKAAAYLRKAYDEFVPIPNAPASISTEADRMSQELILGHLIAAFPDDAFCGEEGTAALANVPRHGPRLWVVDPIDGTRGFVTKNGEFAKWMHNSILVPLITAICVLVLALLIWVMIRFNRRANPVASKTSPL